MGYWGYIVRQGNILPPHLTMRLYDVNKDNPKTIDIENIKEIKYDDRVLWLSFSSLQHRDEAKNFLNLSNKVIPEVSTDQLSALARLYGEYCPNSFEFIKPVIKTDYRENGFSGDFNFDIQHKFNKSLLLALLMEKSDYALLLSNIIKVQYHFGEYIIFFETKETCLDAQKKTDWKRSGDKQLIIQFNKLHEISVFNKNRLKKETFYQMIFI